MLKYFSVTLLRCMAFYRKLFLKYLIGFSRVFTIFAEEESLKLLRASAIGAEWCR